MKQISLNLKKYFFPFDCIKNTIYCKIIPDRFPMSGCAYFCRWPSHCSTGNWEYICAIWLAEGEKICARMQDGMRWLKANPWRTYFVSRLILVPTDGSTIKWFINAQLQKRITTNLYALVTKTKKIIEKGAARTSFKTFHVFCIFQRSSANLAMTGRLATAIKEVGELVMSEWVRPFAFIIIY